MHCLYLHDVLILVPQASRVGAEKTNQYGMTGLVIQLAALLGSITLLCVARLLSSDTAPRATRQKRLSVSLSGPLNIQTKKKNQQINFSNQDLFFEI